MTLNDVECHSLIESLSNDKIVQLYSSNRQQISTDIAFNVLFAVICLISMFYL